MKKLYYCSNCKEKSAIRKIYIKKFSLLKVLHRVEFCINKGCGYKSDLSDLPIEN